VKYLDYRNQLLKIGIGSKAVLAVTCLLKCSFTQMANVVHADVIAKMSPRLSALPAQFSRLVASTRYQCKSLTESGEVFPKMTELRFLSAVVRFLYRLQANFY
jgi:hypothetical protein